MKMRKFLSFILCLISLSCSSKDEDQIKNTMPPGSTISDVLHKYTPSWMKIPGVVGTGEGESEGRPCILVFVIKKSDEITRKIPSVVDGFRVVIHETGEVKPMR